MKNLERLIRCIYKEADFDGLCAKMSQSSCTDGFAFKLVDEKVLQKNVFQEIESRYLRLYPDNYSRAILENIFLEKIGKKECFWADELFAQVAEKYLIDKNENIEIRFDDLLEWNDFINVAPAVVYMAAFHAGLPKHFLPKHDNHRLYSVLKKNKVAENHMHLNASGYSTEINWKNFIYNKPFYNKSACFNDIFYLKVKILRIFMEYLNLFDERTYQKKDEDVLFLSDIRKILKAKEYADISECIDKIKWMQSYLAEHHKERCGRYDNECRFLKDCFDKIEKKSDFFRDLFNLYLVGLIKIYFQFTLDNIGMGFEKFQECQDKKGLFIDENQKAALYKSIFDKYSEEGIVSKIEFRIAPLKRGAFKKIKKGMETFEQNGVRCGYIFHFIKRDIDDNGTRSKRCRFDNEVTAFEQLKKKHCMISRQAQCVLNVLRSGYGECLLGIDAAGNELNIAPEFFAPYFRRCRAEKKDLFFTYHVGEVYTSLCSGLRAIYETIDFFNFRRGDRLGHALALGADPEQISNIRMNRIVIPRGEYLDNLAWIYFMLKSGQADPVLLFKIADRFLSERNKLFNGKGYFRNIDIDTYLSAWRLRADDPFLYEYNGPLISVEDFWRKNIDNPEYRSVFSNKTAQRLHWHYLYDDSFIRKRADGIEIQIDDIYLKCLSECQSLLKKTLVKKGIAVETNPSSNRKISPINNYFDLPLFFLNTHKLYSLKTRKKSDYDVPVSINTDDSAVFQTSLGMEYALVARALLEKGASAEEVYDYIGYLCQSSLEQSFVKEDKEL